MKSLALGIIVHDIVRLNRRSVKGIAAVRKSAVLHEDCASRALVKSTAFAGLVTELHSTSTLITLQKMLADICIFLQKNFVDKT